MQPVYEQHMRCIYKCKCNHKNSHVYQVLRVRVRLNKPTTTITTLFVDPNLT